MFDENDVVDAAVAVDAGVVDGIIVDATVVVDDVGDAVDVVSLLLMLVLLFLCCC